MNVYIFGEDFLTMRAEESVSGEVKFFTINTEIIPRRCLLKGPYNHMDEELIRSTVSYRPVHDRNYQEV
jgi:hypothetical protein